MLNEAVCGAEAMFMTSMFRYLRAATQVRSVGSSRPARHIGLAGLLTSSVSAWIRLGNSICEIEPQNGPESEPKPARDRARGSRGGAQSHCR